MLSSTLVAALVSLGNVDAPVPARAPHTLHTLGPALTFDVASRVSSAAPARASIFADGVVSTAPALRPRVLGLDVTAARLAQAAPANAAGASGSAAVAPATPVTTTTTVTAAPATGTPAQAEEPEPSIDLLRQRAALTRIHRPLGIATEISLGVTVLLGTISAVNQPTWFGPGACSSASGCIGGSYVGGITTLHEVTSFITTGLYTSTAIFAAAMPDPEKAGDGSGRRATRLRVHRAFRAIHLVGMILQPLLGIIAANPGVVGVVVDPSVPGDFQRVQNFQAGMRSVHLLVGYTTFAALTGAMIVEAF